MKLQIEKKESGVLRTLNVEKRGSNVIIQVSSVMNSNGNHSCNDIMLDTREIIDVINFMSNIEVPEEKDEKTV